MRSRARLASLFPWWTASAALRAAERLLRRGGGGDMFIDYRHVAVGFGVGVGVGLSLGALAPQQQQRPPRQSRPRRQQAPPPPQPQHPQTLSAHPAAKYGVPQTQTLRELDGFLAAFDSERRNPAWVIEHVTREKMNGEAERGNSMFYEDEALDERLRSRLVDFRNSGYDRGHLAPAANHKGQQGAMDGTFCLSNISPQVGDGFNRDYWARFEKFVKDAAKKADDLYVVTGPLYLPSPDGATTTKWRANHAYIGTPPSLVAVPTHFYKVVLADNESGKHGPHRAAVAAFVMPNAAIDAQTPLEAFTVPLDALERAAGTSFFPRFVDASRREALDRTALALQERGRGRQALGAGEQQQAAAMLLQLPPSGKEASSGSPPPPLPKTTGDRRGAVHLCEHVACKLPREKWWLDGKKAHEAGGALAASSGRAASAPPPSASS